MERMRLSPLDRIPSDRAVLDAFAWEHRDRCGTDTRNAETTPGEGSVNAVEIGAQAAGRGVRTAAAEGS